MMKNYFLAIVALIFSGKAICQTNYTVNPIPFQQFTGTMPALLTSDDLCSGLINLPFTFDFYGVSYNQVVISTNGYIDFRTTSANSGSPWSFSQTIPNVNFPVKNSILGAFTDLNNSNGQGTITYGSYGVAPFRKFVVYFNNNSFFSCTTFHSSFQMILYESQSIIDVQLIDKQTCPTWNAGRTVTGLIDLTGGLAIAPAGRNTGSWTAFHEGWRFSRPGYFTNYSFVKCDNGGFYDGFDQFNLQVIQNDLAPSNPSSIAFYETMSDAQGQVYPINLTYFNVTNNQIIYASGNGQIRPITLSVIDCTIDNDNDTVSTDLEDANGDTNLANDDTDSDGIPNYLDNDDDGDLILTNLEYVFGRNVTTLLDTDSDGIPNYLDNDDDQDGVLTFNEDYNGNGSPADDDTNANGTPDYLEMGVALGLPSSKLQDTIQLYPNPASDILNIDNKSGETISNIAVYSISGALVKQQKSEQSIETISVSDLQSGIYFVKVYVNDVLLNYKFIKK